VLKYLARRAVAAFERRWNYDASYVREVLDEGGVAAILPLDALTKVGKYRRDIPASVYYAAKVTASVAADCGACAQLTLSMAEAEGVGVETLRALVAGDRTALGEDERLGYDLARATLAHEPADDVREAVLRRWSRRGLVSLAYALVAAQAYPTFKYALGHGHACTRLRAGGIDLLGREKVQA
jgi:hypothetical protein